MYVRRVLVVFITSLCVTVAQFAENTTFGHSNCSNDCSVGILTESLNNSLVYRTTSCPVLNYTPHCWDTVEKLYPLTDRLAYDGCGEILLHVDILPYLWKSEDGYKFVPNVRLNITAVVHNQVAAVQITVECLVGSPNELLCHQKQRPWGRFWWPCRFYDYHQWWHNEDSLLPTVSNSRSQSQYYLPLRVNQRCFAINDNSQFRINVTLFQPHNCTSSYFVSISSRAKTVPEFGKFHHPLCPASKSRLEWAPLIIVDVSPPTGVWIRFSPPPVHFYIRSVQLALFTVKLSSANKVSLDDRSIAVSVASNKTGAFFADLPAGNYTAAARMLEPDCHLLLRFRTPTDRHCVCTEARVDFWLTTDHLSDEWHARARFVDVTDGLMKVVVGILMMVLLVLIAVAVYRRWCRRRSAMSPPELTSLVLERRPSVLLLYTDDEDAHSECVARLATVLAERANCNVALDVWSTADMAARSPDEWLLKNVGMADYFIIVFSRGTQLAFQADPLPNRRHFPDLFSPGMSLVLQSLLVDLGRLPTFVPTSFESGLLPTSTSGSRPNGTYRGLNSPAYNDNITAAASPLSKYIWLTFDYSSQQCIEPFLAQTGCAQYRLGEQTVRRELVRLVAHLHRVPYETVDDTTTIECDQLTTSLRSASRLLRSDEWLTARRRRSGDDNNASASAELSRLATSTHWQPLLDVQQAFVLLNSRHEEASDGVSRGNEFELVPPPSTMDETGCLLEDQREFEVVGSPDDVSDDD